MNEIDCRFPTDVEASIARGRGPFCMYFSYLLTRHLLTIDYLWDCHNRKVHGWMYLYIKEVVAPLADKLCSVNAMKYSEIMNWDRKIREFSPPCIDETALEHRSDASSIASFLHTVYKEISELSSADNDVEINSSSFFLWHTIALLFIHRNLFVRALRENPTDPTQSRFAPSFLTTYSSATTVLEVIRRECEREQSLLMRQWPMWVHTISVGVSYPTFHAGIFV